MKKIRKISVIMLVVATICLPISSYAANGTLTFAHGNDLTNQKVYGRINSTEKENGLGIELKINFSDGTKASYSGGFISGVRSWEVGQSVRGKKGSSFCDYYCSEELVHSSTSWFDFDFTK